MIDSHAQVPRDIGERLARELGTDRVIRPESERIEDYRRDWSHVVSTTPDCVVVCDCREQVEITLRLALEHRVPVTPRGAGSGKCGGALPMSGGIVLSTEGMTKILDIDEDDLVAVTEPGVITGELQSAVENQGLFYPPDPASIAMCSIGGNAATNAGGPRAFKYGVTREYVLGCEVGLMGGELLRVGRRTAKGVTGYDLTACFVGSEGTFGVITELTLKLLPKPPGVATVLAAFADMKAAAQTVTAVLKRGFRPRTIEFSEELALAAVRDQLPIPKATKAIVLLELDGDPETLDTSAEKLAYVCDDNGALDIFLAQDEAQRRRFWQARRDISPGLRKAYARKISEDVCVPRGSIVEMLTRIDKISAQFDCPIAVFGHAGDGNLHVNLLLDDARASDYDSDIRRLDAATAELLRQTVALGGTLSGEHGIGSVKAPFVHLEQGERLIHWQHELKKLWDPSGLLNPGKKLPARPRACHE